MSPWVRAGLLLIALVACAAGGAALAALRARSLHEGRTDHAMISVAVALLAVGALCTAAGGGLIGVLAFGGVSVWASYIATAQRLGIFRVQSAQPEEAAMERHHPHA